MEKNLVKRSKTSTRTLAYTGLMTAMVMVCTMAVGIRTGESFTNVGDSVIFITAALFGPFPAMIAGGFGSFFADLAVYPATMWFTLFIKGFEGLACGLVLRAFKKLCKNVPLEIGFSAVAMLVGGGIMMAGYFICKTFFYGTYASALVSLPKNAIQAGLSTVIALVMLYALRLIEFRKKLNFGTVKTQNVAYIRDESDRHGE